MCTAVTYRTKDFYFGRTLDYEFSYGDEVTIAPRNFPFPFRHKQTVTRHYAIIGMAHVSEEYPLYYDAINEKGLCIAGLNFVGNACFREKIARRNNVAQFEFIPELLGACATVKEAKALIKSIHFVNTPFSESLPPAELHWMIADRREAITLECVKEGVKLYDNPVGVLTNNPPFPEQLFRLNDYMGLTPKPPKNTFAKGLRLSAYSRGMGALGLPGDFSSRSRFVRAAFVKMNSASGDSESESVNQFFHILGAVDQPRGCCNLGEGKYETTIYTSCCNADKGIYYYTTYGNHRITAIRLRQENLEGSALVRYPLVREEQIKLQN